MKKRLLSLILLAALLVCMMCPIGAANDTGEKAEASQGAIVYIPLDDRPLNLRRVQQLADSLDLQLILPDTDLYATKLDGQPKNANGTQSGDRGALMAWLMEQAEQYDTFIISLDQLLSGGLMNSRCMMEMEPVTLPNGKVMTEYDIIDYIGELANTKHVYVIDSVLRLAMSSGFGGYGLHAYSLTRSYGMKARPTLTGWKLTLENVIKNYPNCIDEQDADSSIFATDDAEMEAISVIGLEAALKAESRTAAVTQTSDDEIIANYLKIRERKLRLVDYALRHLAFNDNIEYVLGVDDSSDGNNIHTNEIAYVERIAGNRITILSALDGIAQMILSKHYGEKTDTQSTTLGVKYYGIEGDWVPTYNYMTVSELLDSTASYIDAQITEDEGDISLLMVASTSDSEHNRAVFSQLIDQINANEQNNVPTILMDFTSNDRSVLHSMLIESVHLGYLLSYSGCNDGVIQVPIALSYGVSRYRSLSQNISEEARRAQVGTMVTALLKEYYKADGVLAQTSRQLDLLGVNCNNFATDDLEKLASYSQILDDNMKADTAELLDNVCHSNSIVSLSPFTTAAISGVEIPRYNFPWNRTFEIDFEVNCTFSEEAYSYHYHAPYVQGMGDGTFHPGDSLSRNQAAKMLVSASEAKLADALDCPFDDVPGWARAYVATAYNRGYMRGYTDGTFRGQNRISRAEFVAMLAQYLKAENVSLEPTTDASFTDVPKDGSAWYTQSVYLLANAGIITGYKDGTFRPQANVNRTEAVVMLNRLFGRTDSAPSWATTSSLYSDVSTSYWGFGAITEASVGHFAS